MRSPTRRHSADAANTPLSSPARPSSSSAPSSPRLGHRRRDRSSVPSSPQHLSIPHFPHLHLPVSIPHSLDITRLVAPLTPFLMIAFYTFMTSVAAFMLAAIMAMGFGLTAWDDFRKTVRDSKGVKGWIEDAKGKVQKAVRCPRSS